MVAWVQLGSQKGLETRAMLGFECRQFEFKLDANFIGFAMILQVRFTYNVFFLSNFSYSVSVVKMWGLGGDPAVQSGLPSHWEILWLLHTGTMELLLREGLPSLNH